MERPAAQAEGVHAMAVGAFPFLKSIPSEQFLKCWRRVRS